MASVGDRGQSTSSVYLSKNSLEHSTERLALLSQIHDPATIEHLEALGVSNGWRCLEVGAGGGSIARWLCRAVAPDGSVVATDIDTRFLSDSATANLEVRRHDVVSDEIEADTYDLVHARLLLMHLAERDRALDRMVSALKPGGWILIEEGDHGSQAPAPRTEPARADLFARVQQAQDRMRNDVGDDRYYGRRLYGDLLARGLIDLRGQGRVDMVQGGSARARFRMLTPLQHRDRLLAGGHVSETDLEAYLALLNDPGFLYVESTMMAVWGRRPSAQ